ncbi:Zinc finger FYVE-related protein [Penicillium bovifimosum]|uniref:Zinc finger FYVE-related protein n=1 Tax=Penicillium bovifimosum TaxID=126998 RepID=A0A9W9GXB4_9EURO|nr:Zinc finger FYVE-related protein [Penicillium bovifimosum]KAJ5131558.1 Zinc finger FYVE-related protein [Penicillium bovifimosum]
MATHVMTSTVPANQISIYGQPSPTNSTTNSTTNSSTTISATNSVTNSTTNNSPTSPRMTTASLHQLPLQSRQLRPLKGPLYVPAALRPTERPQKSSPITPPRSVHGSLDSLNEDTEPITRRSTMESQSSEISQVAQHEWMKNEHLGMVTGPPTREHWKADSASSNCDSPTCRSSFGIFLRRHHCRHCGHVFCSSHTPHLVPLDQEARFHPDGVLSRSCDLCWSAYQRWEESRSDRLSKIQSNIDARHGASVPDFEGMNANPGAERNPSEASEVAASVPRDWNWSTF